MQNPQTAGVIGVIGAGRLAKAFVAGLERPVLIASRTTDSARELARTVDGEALTSNRKLAERAGTIVLTVEPQAFDEVAEEIKGAVDGKTVISLLGRTPLPRLQAALPGANVARAMPNVAMQIRQSTTCISCEAEAGREATQVTRRLFDQVGQTFEIPDAQMDVLTWICGSAPAWNSFFVEAWINAVVLAGLDPKVAEVLAVEALRGAAEMLIQGRLPDIDSESLGLDQAQFDQIATVLRNGVATAFDAAVSTPHAPSPGR